MVGRETFDAVGGLDERFEVCGGDVDLGLRLHERGYWNVMTPYCRLIHHESASRDRNPPAGDISESRRAYARFLIDGDPFYNINLTRSDTSCALARPARALVDR
jgi:GT2 family glycosyltransferase